MSGHAKALCRLAVYSSTAGAFFANIIWSATIGSTLLWDFAGFFASGALAVGTLIRLATSHGSRVPE